MRKPITLLLVALTSVVVHSQIRQDPGKSIGSVTTQGNLIVMELNEGVWGKANIFDLAHRITGITLPQFIPYPSPSPMLMGVPLGIIYLILALWLIAKGFLAGAKSLAV